MIDYNELKEKMLGLKFQLGMVISTSRDSYFDHVFGVSGIKVGIINGYDFEHNYYRVYYDKDSPYVGTREELISIYDGKVSEDLMMKKREIENKCK